VEQNPEGAVELAGLAERLDGAHWVLASTAAAVISRCGQFPQIAEPPVETGGSTWKAPLEAGLRLCRTSGSFSERRSMSYSTRS
jgi:hypothetical protein